MKSNQPKVHCNLCSRPIFDSIKPEKIITCANCVLPLMGMEKDLKVYYRDKLLEAGHIEQARSIESFIVEEEIDGELRATFKREGIGKVTRNIDRRIGRVSKARVPMGEDREKSLLL